MGPAFREWTEVRVLIGVVCGTIDTESKGSEESSIGRYNQNNPRLFPLVIKE